MSKAVIDIGTNTFHLLIANIINSKVEFVFKKTIAVKLGEGGINKGEIMPEPYLRGINTLIDFKKEMVNNGVSTVKATATAAIRDAKNGHQFINEVLEKTNIQIEIIDGQKEAFYIYQGAKAAGALSDNNVLLIDIGGGSVEFIIGNNKEILWKNSYRLGAARLLADFYKEELLSFADLKKMNDLFDETLKELKEACKVYKPIELIGTAGAFDSFRDILAAQQENNIKEETILVNLENVSFLNLLKYIIQSSHEERTKIKGLIPLRIDMILMASVLSNYIIQKTQINKYTACSYSLKEGLLYS